MFCQRQIIWVHYEPIEPQRTCSFPWLWFHYASKISVSLSPSQNSICQCHRTKARGNLFMPNMPPDSTFGSPFERSFLIKRGLLSSPLAEECFWYLPLLLCLWTQCQLLRRVGHDNISFNYSFNVTTILLPFCAIPSQQSIPANRGVTHGPA